jgi:hypothetical protein
VPERQSSARIPAKPTAANRQPSARAPERQSAQRPAPARASEPPRRRRESDAEEPRRRRDTEAGGSRRRRDSDAEAKAPTRRTQSLRPQQGRGMALPVILVVAVLVALGVGAASLSTGESKPADPAELARKAFDTEASLVDPEIRGARYAEAEQRIAELETRLDDPLLASQLEALRTHIDQLRHNLALARLEDQVQRRDQALWQRLRDVSCEPELESLAAEIAAFVVDPVADSGAQTLAGFDAERHRARFADATRLLGKERERRSNGGLITPRWPATTEEGAFDRMQRRHYQSLEKLLPEMFAKRNYRNAFEQISQLQGQYPDYSFKQLWLSTVAALKKEWPAIERECRALVDQAAKGDDEQKAEARRKIKDLIADLGDDTYMAQLRPLLLELQ